MQYIKEQADGSRNHVTMETWQLDRVGQDKRNYVQLVAAGNVIIYHMNGRGYITHKEERLSFGGRKKRVAIGFHV